MQAPKVTGTHHAPPGSSAVATVSQRQTSASRDHAIGNHGTPRRAANARPLIRPITLHQSASVYRSWRAAISLQGALHRSDERLDRGFEQLRWRSGPCLAACVAVPPMSRCWPVLTAASGKDRARTSVYLLPVAMPQTAEGRSARHRTYWPAGGRAKFTLNRAIDRSRDPAAISDLLIRASPREWPTAWYSCPDLCLRPSPSAPCRGLGRS